jgi:hypothetical protein
MAVRASRDYRLIACLAVVLAGCGAIQNPFVRTESTADGESVNLRLQFENHSTEVHSLLFFESPLGSAGGVVIDRCSSGDFTDTLTAPFGLYLVDGRLDDADVAGITSSDDAEAMGLDPILASGSIPKPGFDGYRLVIGPDGEAEELVPTDTKALPGETCS